MKTNNSVMDDKLIRGDKYIYLISDWLSSMQKKTNKQTRIIHIPTDRASDCRFGEVSANFCG
jgi:hypothetical protein